MIFLLASLTIAGCTVPTAPVPPPAPPAPPSVTEAAPPSIEPPPRGAPPTRGEAPPRGESGPAAGPDAPSVNGRGKSGDPRQRVATDLSMWRGSPVQMVAAAAASAPERVAFAQEAGAITDISVTPSTYTLTWIPPGGAKGVLVTLHGHGAYAHDELYLWHEHAKKRGIAIVAVQWWSTLFESESDYIAPKPLYDVIAATVKKRFGDSPPPVVLHGFSRGSAQSYAVAAFDHAATPSIFRGVIANAGGVEEDYPSTRRINNGDFGVAPFANQTWVLACAGRDYQPEVSGCPAMERTARWVEKQGGKVTSVSKENGAHGYFQKDAEDLRTALDLLFPETK